MNSPEVARLSFQNEEMTIKKLNRAKTKHFVESKDISFTVGQTISSKKHAEGEAQVKIPDTSIYHFVKINKIRTFLPSTKVEGYFTIQSEQI